jgi:hypothetical protein
MRRRRGRAGRSSVEIKELVRGEGAGRACPLIAKNAMGGAQRLMGKGDSLALMTGVAAEERSPASYGAWIFFERMNGPLGEKN